MPSRCGCNEQWTDSGPGAYAASPVLPGKEITLAFHRDPCPCVSCGALGGFRLRNGFHGAMLYSCQVDQTDGLGNSTQGSSSRIPRLEALYESQPHTQGCVLYNIVPTLAQDWRCFHLETNQSCLPHRQPFVQHATPARSLSKEGAIQLSFFFFSKKAEKPDCRCVDECVFDLARRLAYLAKSKQSMLFTSTWKRA